MWQKKNQKTNISKEEKDEGFIPKETVEEMSPRFLTKGKNDDHNMSSQSPTQTRKKRHVGSHQRQPSPEVLLI